MSGRVALTAGADQSAWPEVLILLGRHGDACLRCPTPPAVCAVTPARSRHADGRGKLPPDGVSLRPLQGIELGDELLGSNESVAVGHQLRDLVPIRRGFDQDRQSTKALVPCPA